MRLGPLEIGLILVVVLIIFGAGKLPQVGGALGKGIREFRKATQGDYDDEANNTKAAKRANQDKGDTVEGKP